MVNAVSFSSDMYKHSYLGNKLPQLHQMVLCKSGVLNLRPDPSSFTATLVQFMMFCSLKITQKSFHVEKIER